jgi:hypothetical protein
VDHRLGDGDRLDTFKINLIGDAVPWPGLDNAVFITLYNKPYAAVWNFQPLATGTAILVAAMITSALCGVGPRGLLQGHRRHLACRCASPP